EAVLHRLDRENRGGGGAGTGEGLVPEGHEVLGLAELRAVIPQRVEGHVEQRHAGGLHGEDRAEPDSCTGRRNWNETLLKVTSWFRLRLAEGPVKACPCGYRSTRCTGVGASGSGER